MPRYSRWIVASVVGLVGLVNGSSARVCADEQPRQPNIVLIMADDLGWMDLHCQGNHQLDTPHLDRLASQGMRFTSAYAAAPVCTPTCAAIMTGWAPARLHITNHAPGNPDYVSPQTGWKGAEWTTHLGLEHVTIAERLRSAGYATGFFGKWHLSHRLRKAKDGPSEEQLRAEFQGVDINIGGCSYGGPIELFDLESDIGEQTNLAPQMPQTAAALREELQAWLEETGANLPVRVAAAKKP